MQCCIYPSSSVEERKYGKVKKTKNCQDRNKQKKDFPPSLYDVADRSLGCNSLAPLPLPSFNFPHIHASLQTLFS